MRVLHLDLETYSSSPLPKCGVYRYCDLSDFEILLLSYAFDDGPVITIDLACGEMLPDEFLKALEDPTILKIAHNAVFERVCFSKYLGHWLDPAQWRCTMVMAWYSTLPGRLADAAVALNVTEKKMEEGKDLIRYFSVPCKPTKTNGGRTRNLPQHAPEKWATYKKYNAQDVETERAVYHALLKHPLPEHEWELYALDQRINDRGVRVDRLLVKQAMAVDLAFSRQAFKRAQELTGLENPGSVSQLKAWLADMDMPMESLSKRIVQEKAAEADGIVKELLELRLELSKTSIKKYEAMARTVCRDGRVHGMLQFGGASRTFRWAGRLVQLQNVPQNHLPDLRLARDIVKRSDEEQLEMLFGSVPNTLSELIRTAFIPREGCRFIVADFSAIEARVLAWLAGEEWVLAEFRGKGKIYEATASRMFHIPQKTIVKGHSNYEYRQKGKQATLSCIAEGQLVLTDQGLVPIEQIQLHHKVWDGENWVSHEGLVYRGKREVITYEGLTATADHLVWVKGRTMPISFGQAAAIGLHLVECGKLVYCDPNEMNQRLARVYDLRNAGPHHRFTVSGRLVHNCGYGGGVGALKAMGAKMPEEEMQPLVDAWRAANPHIVQFWYALGNAASEVIEKHNSVRVGKVKVYWQDNRLLIRLPSGRDLCYLSPRFVTNRFGSRGIGYLAASANGKMEMQETFGGKIVENCLAEGTLVITNFGLVPIEHISASHLVWDGEAFVHHGGVLSKGVQPTICVNGIWMTTEHKILTEKGMAACGQSEGLNWASVQLPDGFEEGGKQQTRQTDVEMQMRLRQRDCGSGILSQQKRQKISSAFVRMHEKQADQPGTDKAWHEPPSRICGVAFYEAAVRRPTASGVPKLWGTRNQSVRRMAAQLRNVLARHGTNVQAGFGTGSDRQRQGILRRKLSLGRTQNQRPKPQGNEVDRHTLWQNVGGGAVRTNGHWRNDDFVSIGSQVADRISMCKTRLPKCVYDIRNCGPRHRFAVWANGHARVVSNCTQAIARDLLAHAMQNLEVAGYPIVFHVHDEAVMEVPIGQDGVEEACRIMAIPPDWAQDLPLRADGEEMEFYRK